jgi:hypothetical protein
MVTATGAQSHLSRTRSPGVTLFANRSLMLGLGLATRYQRRRDYRGCNQEPCEGPVRPQSFGACEPVDLRLCLYRGRREEGKKVATCECCVPRDALVVCSSSLLWRRRLGRYYYSTPYGQLHTTCTLGVSTRWFQRPVSSRTPGTNLAANSRASNQVSWLFFEQVLQIALDDFIKTLLPGVVFSKLFCLSCLYSLTAPAAGPGIPAEGRIVSVSIHLDKPA